MFTISFNVKLMVSFLIMAHYGSCLTPWRKLIAPFKPSNCFIPAHCLDYKYFNFENPDQGIGAWYFSDFYKACVPYYIYPSRENCCTGLDILPRTRKECEDMCGEPCIVTHANFKTEPGICTLSCFIDVPSGVPAPCKTYDGTVSLKCCPRGYQATSFLLEEYRLNVSKWNSEIIRNLTN